MAISNVRNKRNRLLRTLGEIGLHSLFPNDFEYYACSLELRDSFGFPVDMLVFPVMPDSIRESETAVVNIKKSAFGVVSLFNPSFIPFDISISGQFGKKLRVLLGGGFLSLGVPLTKGEYNPPIFNTRIKTGYGVIKVLERIYRTSQGLDSAGLPFKLFFFNLALNSSYLVELKHFEKSMTIQTNRVWQYSLQMKAIAPAFSVRSNLKTSIIAIMALKKLNEGLSTLIGSISTLSKSRKVI